MSKKLLITGGSGFIGSNFITYLMDKYPDYLVVNLDLLTYAANVKNLKKCESLDNYIFIQGNICDPLLLNDLFKKYEFDGVIHFAAESHVDNSINFPKNFIDTNITGTFNLLETCKNYWMDAPNMPKKNKEACRFHHISTDEVYGSIEKGLFKEDSPYNPTSPYAASKASSNHLASSYFLTFGLNVTISNCSNNYGAYQHDEKLIPTIIKKAIHNEAIPIYGDGKNIRDWIFVTDHCKAIDLVFHNAKNGSCYNIGGVCEKTNLEVASTILDLLGKNPNLITFVKDRPGHDFRYAIDPTKIITELNWKTTETFLSGLKKTISYYFTTSSKEF